MAALLSSSSGGKKSFSNSSIHKDEVRKATLICLYNRRSYSVDHQRKIIPARYYLRIQGCEENIPVINFLANNFSSFHDIFDHRSTFAVTKISELLDKIMIPREQYIEELNSKIKAIYPSTSVRKEIDIYVSLYKQDDKGKKVWRIVI